MKNEKDPAAEIVVPKLKFKPKIPVRKHPKSAAPKAEPSEAKTDLIDKELLAKLNNAKSEDGSWRRPKMERKAAPVHVAFGHERKSSIRSFGNPRSVVTGRKLEDGADDLIPLLKEYVEPWDYVRSNYPVTLPLRRPYSGDPEILDKEEFGEGAMNEGNKPAGLPAEELGLMEASSEPQMILFQFPAALPFTKPPSATATATATAKADEENRGRNNMPAGTHEKSKAGCTLKDLPAGYLGKMLVFKSGKIKMKIGDTLFDVSAGQDCMFAQDAAVINIKEKHCCVIGDIPKRAVVTPDVDALLDAIDKL